MLSPAAGTVDIVRSKLAHLAAHRSEYDTLFIGSSRVQVHLDPAAFDAAAGAQGEGAHSFNFGVLGMFAPENAFVAEQLFALRPHGVKRVFLEFEPIITSTPAGVRAGERSLAWHDWPRTRLLCRRLWQIADEAQRRQDEKAQPKKQRAKKKGSRWAVRRRAWSHTAATAWRAWPGIAPHLESLAAHYLNLGRGALSFGKALLPPEKTPSEFDQEMGPAGNGFFALSPNTRAEIVQEMRQNVQQRLAKPGRVVPLDAISQENLDGMVRLIRRAGAVPILYQTPNVWPVRRVPAHPMDVAILDFSDVRQWPDLYDAHQWHDTGHLDGAGAQILTRHLVEEWLKLPPERAGR